MNCYVLFYAEEKLNTYLLLIGTPISDEGNWISLLEDWRDLYSALYYMIPAFFLVLCFDFLIFKVCGRKKVSKCFSAVYEVYKGEEWISLAVLKTRVLTVLKGTSTDFTKEMMFNQSLKGEPGRDFYLKIMYIHRKSNSENGMWSALGPV